MIKHKTIFFTAMACAGIFAIALPAHAQTDRKPVSGYIETVYGHDYSDLGDYFTIALSQAGPCGSSLFVIPRSSVAFKDMVAVSLSAFLGNKRVNVWQKGDVKKTGCYGNRNIIDEINASRN